MVAELIASMLPADGGAVATIGFLPGHQPPIRTTGPARLDLDEVDPAAAPDGHIESVVLVVARSFTDLRRAVTVGAMLPAAPRVVIVVAEPAAEPALPAPWRWPGWPAGATAARADYGADGEWFVEVTLPAPVPAGDVLAAVAVGSPGRSRSPEVAVAGAGAPHGRPGDQSAARAGARCATVDPDLSWASLGAPGSLPRARHLLTCLADVDRVPPFDERTVNPCGYLARPTRPGARLTQRGGGWWVVGDTDRPVALHPSGTVTDADVSRLRPLRSVTVDWGRHSGPISAVRSLAALAGAGVPLRTTAVPAWAAALGPELIDLLTGVAPDDLDDDLLREEHSVRLRRAAFRRHSTRARRQALAGAAGQPPPAPTVSVLLRAAHPDHLASALAQVARQRGVEVEVVLTLPGLPATAPVVRRAVADLAQPPVVVETARDLPAGEALHRVASAASGDYLTTWRDTDWYGPDHLADLLMAAQYSGADLVGCADHVSYLAQIDLTVHRLINAERWDRDVVAEALLVDRDVLRGLGRRWADAGLLRAVGAAGGAVYRTHGLGHLSHRSADEDGRRLAATLRGSGQQWRGLRLPALVRPEEGR